MKTNTKTTTVYIITKEGKNFNIDGVNYIARRLRDDFGVTEELTILSGVATNDKAAYLAGLEAHPDAYTVLSLPETVVIFPKESNDSLIRGFRTAIKMGRPETTWDLLCEANAEKQ